MIRSLSVTASIPNNEAVGLTARIVEAWMHACVSEPRSKLRVMAGLFGKTMLGERARQIQTDHVQAHIDLVRTWHKDYHEGPLKTDNETSREQAYNQDFFITILGYRQAPIVPATFKPKDTTESKQFPDAVLKYEDASADVRSIFAVVELKGASIPLDKPQRREGNLTPVQQAFKYKPQYPTCPFVVVSNFYEFRLYNNNQLVYERWTLDDLVDPDDDYIKFKTWYLLMHVDNFTVERGQSQTQVLLRAVQTEQEKIGKEFYEKYKEARIELLRDILKKNPTVDSDLAIEKAQTIIDRVVFACFAEDIDLLPPDTIGLVIREADASRIDSNLFNAFKRLFAAIDKGSKQLDIPNGYNGGLFAHDEVIDSLDISDDVMRRLGKLGEDYEFADELPVNVLGHIFEQSITDLESIRRQIHEDVDPDELTPDSSAHDGQRHKEGIYYTPDYIVQYIVDNTVGTYLREKELELQAKHKLTGRLGEKGYEERQQKAYIEFQFILQDIKVLDLACGSGAFLVYVFDYLLRENQRVADILGDAALHSTDEFVRNILTTNIFGVDLNRESVEITKLSLWLKTAEKNKPLASLDGNIKCGNSLIDNAMFTDKPFNWSEDFSAIVAKGGFDIVVGNPPYVNAIEMSKNIHAAERKFMRSGYTTAVGAVDLYIYFFERGIELLKKGGKLGFITPNRWLSVSYGAALRQWLIDKTEFESILNASDTHVFEDADVYPVITILNKRTSGTPYKITAGRLEEMSALPLGTHHDSTKLSSLPDNIMGFLLNDKLPITEKVFGQSQRLGVVGEINATSTAGEADDYAAHISDLQGHKIINTGTIDQYTSLWGLRSFRKQGSVIAKPYLDLDQVSDNRRALYESSKIIFAKIALRAEAVYDSLGEYASIDTNCIHTFSDDFLPEYVLSWVNSRLYNYVFTCLFDGARMAGGYLGFSAPNLRCTPIKRVDINAQEPFVKPATRLSALYREKAEADEILKTLIKTTFELTSWPTANGEWWAMESPVFISNFRKRFSTSQVEDLMGAHAKYATVMNEKVSEILKLNQQIDRTFYKLFGLTRREIELVEAMEFTYL
ncbi:Eco57I restriction-modification methylase domain-containing protein [Mycobacteroides abscessus]|uniref:Eco57I restriction-modification methylase domain-containing protein n=1 Tax=Mycobacteroides abscessus TaxID=36809 RepID=UPI000C26B872|nr:N-6 DNA methylase [Mycobacteroides abscessus]